jgi:HD-GYP domain-containing protein (c-di-GMP phosphodiesterase class II)
MLLIGRHELELIPLAGGATPRSVEPASHGRPAPAWGLLAAGDAAREQELATVLSLARVVEARDAHTGWHIERVRRYSVELAQVLGLAEDDVWRIGVGAILHDIGKIGVPDVLLNKQATLTPTEQVIMRRHPVEGAELLVGNPALEPARDAVLFHHEHWDGSGYPFGRRAHQIPLDGRIVAIADAFDAMTADRPYRRRQSAARALEELARRSGTQFDPELVRAFMRLPSLAVLSRGAPPSTPGFFHPRPAAA